MKLRDRLAEIICAAHFAAHPEVQFGYTEDNGGRLFDLKEAGG